MRMTRLPIVAASLLALLTLIPANAFGFKLVPCESKKKFDWLETPAGHGAKNG